MDNEKRPKRETPFSEGNPWRFTSSKQPPKRITPKQAIKMLESLLSMTEQEVRRIAVDDESPIFIKKSALMLSEGNPKAVVELLNTYRNGILQERKGIQASY